jgi:outer membrane protein assembly factor BamB
MPLFLRFAVLATAVAMFCGAAMSGGAEEPRAFSLIVMDPLAAPLSCPCVKGYAQRDYQKLADYDQDTLGGWDAHTGTRLWEMTPETDGDFNVPTPVLVGDRLFVNTENNGGRLFEFDADGKLAARPLARYADLTHDTHTPVVVGGRLLAVSRGLHCLDATTLQLIWKADDPAFQEYAALIASSDHVLALSEQGVLLLLDPLADKLRILSRSKLTSERISVLSHPALVGSHLYARVGKRLVCLSLE